MFIGVVETFSAPRVEGSPVRRFGVSYSEFGAYWAPPKEEFKPIYEKVYGGLPRKVKVLDVSIR